MSFATLPMVCVRIYGTYDYSLVTLSYIVAVCASFIALDIATRFKDLGNTRLINFGWLFGGAFAMGAGIWSMHFIGMLAFKMTMPMTFNMYWTIASMLAALIASAIALNLMRTSSSVVKRYVIGGLVIGLGIAAMHYLGMHAMTDTMNIHYKLIPVLISIFIAIAASDAALYLAMAASEIWVKYRSILKILSALVMGAAICGMHYMGMYAAAFSMKIQTGDILSVIDPDYLSKIVSFVSLSILMIAFLISRYKEKQNQKLLNKAIEVGRSEVIVNILHNVGNVLNSINISANLVSDKSHEITNITLSPIINSLKENKENLVSYLSHEQRIEKLIDFMEAIDHSLQESCEILVGESNNLIKNVNHVKSIIHSHQTSVRATEILETISITELINEAILLIFGNHKQISITKSFPAMDTLYVNKTKLLQVLVNLLKNAKEAINEARVTNGQIAINITINNNNQISIAITDNGIGIKKEHIYKIYQHGFSTKEQGNGFGLHSCALFAKDLGGKLEVFSEGVNQGSTFTLYIPYKTTNESKL